MTHTHHGSEPSGSWSRVHARTCFVALGGLLLMAAVPARAQEMPTGPAAREVTALACAPRAVKTVPTALARVAGAEEPRKTVFGEGDIVRLDRQSAEGLEPGKTYFVRRVLTPDERGTGKEPSPWSNLHTVGWLRVESVEGDGARAKVVHSCDTIDVDDSIYPLEVPVVPAPAEDKGSPDFQSPGTVLFGPSNTTIAGEGVMVAIDRGSDDGVATGQHVTFFRRAEGMSSGDNVLGGGVVVLVSPGSATVRVETSRQPIYAGDMVALHR